MRFSVLNDSFILGRVPQSKMLFSFAENENRKMSGIILRFFT
jgi:hypothetical protein